MKTFRQYLKETKLDLNTIHDPQGILDSDKVKSYRSKIRNGESIKDIIVRPLNKRDSKRLGKTHYIYDGSHRYHAHKQEGHTHINAYIANSDDDAESQQLKQSDKR